MRTVYLFFTLIIVSFLGSAQDISGDWTGELNFAGNSLDLNFKVYKSEGNYVSSLSIPAQNVSDLKSSSTTYVDSLLTIEMNAIGAKYLGKKLTKDSIIGNFVQNGMTLKLNLVRGNTKLNRPQEPQPPFNYYVEDVVFRNKIDNINLSGTLTLPKKEGKFPVVILISGSGPQDRNSYIFGHKPFLLLAHELTQSGVGVFRFDERGVGLSEGEFQGAELSDFVKDVESAYDFLKNRKDIDPDKIGLLGHSIGGVVAPKLAVQENTEISFLVLLAAPGVRGDELMLKQRGDLLRLRGLTEAQVKQSNEIFRNTYDFINSTDAEGEKLERELTEFLNTNYKDAMMEKQRLMMVEQITSKEVLALLRNEPVQYLRLVDCPVLAIGGKNDFQVSSQENLATIEFALKEGGNTNVEIQEFEGINHLMQESETGDANEYSIIEQTMSPEVLKLIKTWIGEQVLD
jgi:pimeloyl-ACP methyl ester carboxylesterase